MQPDSTEIDLYNVLYIVWKRKWWFISGILIFTAGAIWINVTGPLYHEAVSIIEIGKIYNQVDNKSMVDLIESPETIKSLLTSESIQIKLARLLGFESSYQSIKGAINISSEMRNADMFPELFLTVSIKLGDPMKAKKGVDFLVKELIKQHEKYFEASTENLKNDLNSVLRIIKNNQVQIRRMRLEIKRIDDQILTNKKYFLALTDEMIALSGKLNESKLKINQSKPDGINSIENNESQTNLKNQQSQLFNINKELNEVTIRSREREKQIEVMTTHINQIENQNEHLQENLDQLGHLQKTMRRTAVITPTMESKVQSDKSNNNMAAFGAMFGFVVSAIIVFFIENKKKIFNRQKFNYN